MTAAIVLALATVAGSVADEFSQTCRPYFGDACSAAIGAWLPRIDTSGPTFVNDKRATMTQVHDEIVDPAGAGAPGPFGQREVYRGTFFVYGLAGRPMGRLVYDPVHRIAYFDEGCCGWHRVVVAGDASPPPQSVVARALDGVRTLHGIRLGDPPDAVRAVFGPSPLRSNTVTGQTTIVYQRAIVMPKPYSTCTEVDTFLFNRFRLRAIEFLGTC